MCSLNSYFAPIRNRDTPERCCSDSQLNIPKIREISARVGLNVQSTSKTTRRQIFLDRISFFTRKCRKFLIIAKIVFCIFLCALYNLYMYTVITWKWHQTKDVCKGVKLLTFTSLVAFPFLIYFVAVKPLFGPIIANTLIAIINKMKKAIPFAFTSKFSIVFGCVLCLAITASVTFDSKEMVLRCVSFAGILFLILVGFIFSKHRRRIDWHLVVWGHVLQFLLAYLLLRWSAGQIFMQCLSTKIIQLINYSNNGSQVLFGYLATGEIEFLNTEMEAAKQTSILAFKAFTAVIFISLVSSLLFYYEILPWLIVKLGWILYKILGSTAVETMNASANIFLGMVEAPLCVKPYLHLLTKAELHTVMASGFATMAGTVFAAYVAMGVNSTHLMVASVMSSPSALAYSKLLYPETKKSKTTAVNIAQLEWKSEQSAVEAVLSGTTAGLILYINILANLICVIAITQTTDALLHTIGSLIGFDELNLQFLLSYMFSPLAFIMGVQWDECVAVGELLGIKTIVNGFVAFGKMISLRENSELTYRSEMIATFAQCSFANIVSMGIMLGGLASIAPSKISDISTLLVRSLCAGSAASFITACVAGVLMEDK